MKRLLFCSFLVLSLYACQKAEQKQDDSAVQPLKTEVKDSIAKPEVKDTIVLAAAPAIPVVPITDPFQTKKIKLLITNHFNTYFLHRGGEYGLEFELLQLYLKKKGFQVDFELIHDIEDVEDSLVAKGAHIAAASFVVQRKPIANELYSDYLYKSNLVLVQRAEKTKPVVTPSEATPVTAHVIKNATYVHTLFIDTTYWKGLRYQEAHHLSTRQSLLEEVSEGKIDYTISDHHEAEIMKFFHPNLNLDVVLMNDAHIGFMFHPQCGELLKDFNDWLKKNRNTSDFQWTVHKYKNFSKELKNAMTHTPIDTFLTTVSTYDRSIKRYAGRINWDWKLLSALIYQESRFDPTRRSWVGAIGLMQVMPRTGLAYGKVTPGELLIPDKNMMAGTAYIRWLEKNYFNEADLEVTERMKFILASYNAGPGHVLDARALAKKNGLDPNVWENNVEKMILAKSYPKYFRDPACKHGYCRGKETAQYVRNIMNYYSHYSRFIKQ